MLEGVCKGTLHHPKNSNGDVVGQVLKNLLTSGQLSTSLRWYSMTLRWQCDVWSGWWRPPSVPASSTTTATTRMGLAAVVFWWSFPLQSCQVVISDCCSQQRCGLTSSKLVLQAQWGSHRSPSYLCHCCRDKSASLARQMGLGIDEERASMNWRNGGCYQSLYRRLEDGLFSLWQISLHCLKCFLTVDEQTCSRAHFGKQSEEG